MREERAQVPSVVAISVASPRESLAVLFAFATSTPPFLLRVAIEAWAALLFLRTFVIGEWGS